MIEIASYHRRFFLLLVIGDLFFCSYFDLKFLGEGNQKL